MNKHILLKNFIKKHYKTFEDLAQEMGIARVTLEYKLNGKNPFTIAEIKWFKEYFKLSDKQVVAFFLN